MVRWLTWFNYLDVGKTPGVLVGGFSSYFRCPELQSEKILCSSIALVISSVRTRPDPVDDFTSSWTLVFVDGGLGWIPSHDLYELFEGED